MEGGPAASAKRKTKEPKPKVDGAATETIRKRLGLSMTEFSTALGFASGGGYSTQLHDGLTKTVALAAEALMRRQSSQGDVAFMVRMVKGVPNITFLEECEEMSMGDKRFMLIPIK